jgi:hypothetical protein
MKRATTVAVALLMALPLTAAAKKQNGMDKAMTAIESAASPSDAVAPMEYILEHSTEAPAVHLFVASAVAMSLNRFEDAAYLFYTAQMRSRYDLARFPPKGTGGDSPAVALGALQQQLGAELNPAIMREPAAFAKTVSRVQSYKPAVPAGYDPGWEYGAVNEADAARQFAQHRDVFVKQMGGLSTLLNDKEYFAAFKTMQDFNFSTYEEQQKPARIQARNTAEAKMREIEQKKGIEGLYRK